jgi:hypothetical protein
MDWLPKKQAALRICTRFERRETRIGKYGFRKSRIP